MLCSTSSACAASELLPIYKGHGVGEYFADIPVEDVPVIELKCAERLSNEHTAPCLNYLQASGRTPCLPVNFQSPKVEWERGGSWMAAVV